MSRLGKGLGALIPNEVTENVSEVTEKGKVLLPLNKIKNNSEQPRKSFDDSKIVELAESIKHHGIIQPILVKKEKNDYIIIAGERRWRAAKMLNLEEVPAIIMDLSDKDVLEISLIENIQRQDLNPIEEAIAYKKLLNDFNITQEELGKRIGKSRTAITNTMRLTNLNVNVQEYIIQGIISEGHGRSILRFPDELQYEIAQKVIDDRLSVRDLEKLYKDFEKRGSLEPKKKQEKNDKELNPYYRDIMNRLQSHFGTKVNIKDKNKKGKIEIEYYSEDDLQRILDMINI